MCRLGSDVHDAGTLRLQLRGRILKALRERRIRVAIVADAITPELVERAEVARERDRTLTIDMIELLPDPNGGVVRRFIEPMADRSRRWHRPVFGTPDWEPVATEPLAAAQLRKKLPRDRFYEGHGPRVLRVSDGFPEAFACERSFGRVPGAGRPIHQVDPSRQESCAPLMPSHRLYVETGAPYPPEPPIGLITDEWYKPLVRISYATWRAFAATGTMVVSGPNDPAVHAVVAAARVQPHQQHAEDALRCVTDTLRDLALWGFVGQARRGFFERRFQLELPNQAR
jgi:hypothetical protein